MGRRCVSSVLGVRTLVRPESTMAFRDDAPRLFLAAALLALAAACSSDPYTIGTTRQPPWRFESVDALPAADPPFSSRSRRIAVCYGRPLNDEQDVLAVVEERCKTGRLVVERRDAFWNGCGLFQPMRATYICDPVAVVSEDE